MGKKGQVTYFVLVGVLLFLSVAAYFAYQNVRVKTGLDLVLAERAKLPQQAQPVIDFVDTCADQATREALNVVGSQGGFVELPPDRFVPSPFAPMPAVLEVVPNSDFRTPFWFREQGNGVPVVNMPAKADVEKNMGVVVADAFTRCAEELASLNSAAVQIEQARGVENISVDVNEQDVQVIIEYPMVIDVLGSDVRITQAFANVQTQFGLLFETAQEVFNAEMAQTFLENKTLDMLIAYDPEIPFSGTSFTCNEKIWSKSQVTSRLKTILFENVAAMRIKGTNYVGDAALEYLVFDVLSGTQPGLTVNMLYSPSWPTLVDIAPSQGDVLKGDVISQASDNLAARALASLFCVSNHHFVYTIKYPVLFTLRDPQGFVFQFATEVIIDRNVPRENLFLAPALPETTSPVCEINDRVLEVNTWSVNAEGEQVPVGDVELAFKCFPHVCPLGNIPLGRSSALVQAPRCLNGVVEATKEGFLAGRAVVSTNVDEEHFTDLVLSPIYEKKIEILVIEKESGQVRKPFSSETVTFQFERAEKPGLNAYVTYQDAGGSCQDDDGCGPGLMCSNNKCAFKSCSANDACETGSCVAGKCAPQNTVRLAVGPYHINSFVSRSSSQPFTTQKQIVQKCINVPAQGLAAFFSTEEKCFTSEIPSVEIPSVLTGGARFDHTLTQSELVDDAPLRLYVLSDRMPASLEEMARVQEVLAANSEHPLFRVPEI